MEENRFMRVDDVAKELDVSNSHAYRIMKALNDELEAMGYTIFMWYMSRWWKSKLCGVNDVRINR